MSAVDVGWTAKMNGKQKGYDEPARLEALEAKRKKLLLPDNNNDRFMLRTFSDKKSAVVFLNEVGSEWRLAHAQFDLCDVSILLERVTSHE